MLKRLLLALAALLLLGNGSAALPVSAVQADAVAQIDTYVSGLTESDQFSGSVLVAQGSELLLSKGYNLANREWNISNAPDTKFRIGSMTKQFTAMSILLLQEQGKLTVDDPVCQYIDNCPASWANITIRQLLTHTSGIPDDTSLPNFSQLITQPASPDAQIRWFIDLPLQFEPGSSWSYSNSNYIVLGRIIEKVAKTSYRRFLQQNLFDPLELADTGYDINANVITHRAEGYSLPDQKATYIDMTIPYAAGGLYSTVEDLYKWDQALFAGRVVSQASWDAMLAAAVPIPADPSGSSYAYGLWIGTFGGHPAMGHGGAIPGFNSSIDHLTDEDFTVIVLSNFEQVNADSVAEQIVKTYFGEN